MMTVHGDTMRANSGSMHWFPVASNNSNAGRQRLGLLHFPGDQNQNRLRTKDTVYLLCNRARAGAALVTILQGAPG